MDMRPLPLPGWSARSTWATDPGRGTVIAQLTADAHADNDRPDVWLAPPKYPACQNVDELAEQIAAAAAVTVAEALAALRTESDG